MAVNQDHITIPKTPFSRTAVCTTAEVGFNAPVNVVDLLLAADNADGARITKLYFIPRAAIGTATNCQLYKRNGATYTLIDSQLMATVSPAANVANPKTDFGITPDAPLELE